MAKTFRWSAELDSISYEITVVTHAWSVNNDCWVNGERIALPRKFTQIFTGLDFPLMLGANVAHLVIRGSNADLAVNDIFLGTENPYLPLQPIPWWAWIFVAICAFLVTGFSVVSVLLAFLGSVYCIRVAVNPNYTTSMKIGLCFGVALASWLVLLVIMSLSYGAGLIPKV